MDTRDVDKVVFCIEGEGGLVFLCGEASFCAAFLGCDSVFCSLCPPILLVYIHLYMCIYGREGHTQNEDPKRWKYGIHRVTGVYRVRRHRRAFSLFSFPFP